MSEMANTEWPLVSIITVTKNLVAGGRAKFFETTIRSVMNQDYGRQNIEHVVIDGGSEDGTLDILEKSLKDGNISRLISEKDEGIYEAMNRGISIARGEYFLILNSDDYLAEGAISELVSGIIRTNSEYVVGNAFVIDGNDVRLRIQVADMRKIYFGAPYCHQALLCRSSVRERVVFDEEYRVTMWPYAFDLYNENLKYSHVHHDVAFFRLGGLSTGTARDTFTDERERFRKDRILPLLEVSADEYAYLDSMWRGRPLPAFQVDVGNLVRRLLLSNDAHQHRFARNFVSLLNIPSRNVTLTAGKQR